MPKIRLMWIVSSLLTVMTVLVAGSHSVSAQPSVERSPVDATAQSSTESVTPEVERAAAASEVKPGDWAYRTLQGLQAKYGCRENAVSGDRTLSREEFATSVNSCVRSMEAFVARRPRKRLKKRRVPAPASVVPQTPEVAPALPEPEIAPVPPAPPEVSRQDLDEIKQLVQAFSVELQALNTRLQAADAKIATLQSQQFSTTTKLAGEAIFAITTLGGGPNGTTRNTIFADRVRLNFNTSFFGKDNLLVRLQSRNSNSFAGPTATSPARTNEARLGFEGSEENTTNLQRLQYKLPVSAQTKVLVAAVGSELNDDYYNFNTELAPAGQGSFTRFGRAASTYRLNNEGASVGVDTKLSPNLGLVVSYAVPRTTPNVTGGSINPPLTASDPAQGGIFGGSNAIFSQLAFKPSETTNLGFAYARTYNSTGTGVSGNNGSNFANNPFNGAPTTADHYTLLASLDLSKSLILSGWGGYTKAVRNTPAGGSADIWEYALTLGIKDFGAKGSTLGFVVGMQPRLSGNSGAPARVDPTTGLHLETFYKYKLSDNLSITPGVLILTNPEHTSGPAEFLGTIRTTFTF